MIYADNAATTKLDIGAFEAMKPFLLNQYANASQPYSFARSTKIALREARATIAACINALPEEIYFTSGGTESDNWALKGIMSTNKEHCSLITSQIEHHAILHSAAAIERMGYYVAYLPVDEVAVVHPETLERYISDTTKLVSVMFSNNEVGSIQPLKELTALAHKHGALFHTDAVQAVGHIKTDVKDLGVDMLSASAHKFNGPKGIGFLYVKNGINIFPLHNGGAQELNKRAGTENIASIVGMAAALKHCCDHIEEYAKHLLKLEALLLSVLDTANINYIRNGAASHVPGNVSLSFAGVKGEMLLHRLDLMGICVSTGSACDSKNTQISHVLQSMHIPERYAIGTIRISFGKDNTEEDAKKIASALIKLVKSIQ